MILLHSDHYGEEIEEETTEDQIQPVIEEDEDNMLIKNPIKKKRRTTEGTQK